MKAIIAIVVSCLIMIGTGVSFASDVGKTVKEAGIHKADVIPSIYVDVEDMGIYLGDMYVFMSTEGVPPDKVNDSKVGLYEYYVLRLKTNYNSILNLTIQHRHNQPPNPLCNGPPNWRPKLE